MIDQIWITKAGAPHVLAHQRAPEPEAEDGEVIIDVAYCGINFADLMARKGRYPDAPKFPFVVGYEVSGTVISCGRDTEGLASGDEVVALTRFGGYSSRVSVPKNQVFKRPVGMTAQEGAAFPVNYLTAFQAMVVMGGLRRQEEMGGLKTRVLVHSASGGVGTAASDLGKIYGAALIGAASPSKHAYLKERGYDYAINYRSENWVEQVLDVTEGQGVDLVLDPIGGNHWEKSLRCLAPTGRLVLFGFSALSTGGSLSALAKVMRIPWRQFLPFTMINQNRGILGVNVGRLWNFKSDVRAWGSQLLQYVEEGKINPHVDRIFPLAEAASAHIYIEERKNRGKVLLQP